MENSALTIICNDLFLNNIVLLDDVYKLVTLCHIQKYELAEQLSLVTYDNINNAINIIINNLDVINAEYEVTNVNFLMQALNNIKSSCENKDYITLTDYYELQIIPLFKDIQNVLSNYVDIYSENSYLNSNLALLYDNNSTLFNIIKSHSVDESKYMLEYTDIGVVCLRTKLDTGHYFHLTPLENPFYDGRVLASEYYKKDSDHYVVYGFGMGYHLIEMSDMYINAHIEIYESDISVLRVAFQYADLSKLLKNIKVSIHYDPDFKKLSRFLNNNDNTNEFIIHYPSIMNIKNHSIKQQMEDLFAQVNNIRSQIPKLNHNFRINIMNYKDSVDGLKEYFENKTLFIVAAGPSLDKNILLLGKVDKNKCIIVAVGTVLKKLLNLGIIPDYFIVSDPNKSVYRQIEGIEGCTIPMLFISTALKDFTLNYRGDKYIICQKDFDLAEQHAAEKGYKLYNTGGSVSTTAIDVGIGLGCRRIVLLGLDLAYTNNFAHATDTSRRNMESTSNMTLVKSVTGDMVYASRAFIWFKDWIEKRISTCSDIEFIDATEGGAYIKGTKVYNFSEIQAEVYDLYKMLFNP